MENTFTCPDCFGDGKETCHNPDHGFIHAMPGDIGRLGCPVCGHDPRGKVRNGGPCETCDGSGVVTLDKAKYFCGEDFEDVMSAADQRFYEKVKDHANG